MKSSIRALSLGLSFGLMLLTPARAGGEPTPPAPAAAPAPAPSRAELSFWKALELLRSSDPALQKRGRAALDFAADRDFAPALLLLGECYQTGGYGYPKRERRAADAFQTAAEQGNGFAMVKYAACLQAGTGLRRDRETAVKWLNRALDEKTTFALATPPPSQAAPADPAPADGSGVAGAAAGDPVANARAQAHYLLGLILQPKDPGAAQAHFVAAATAGPAGRDGVQDAAVQAALAFAFGKGIPHDHARAIEMLEQSRKLARRAGVWMVHNFAAAKLVDEFAVSQLEDTMSDRADAATAGMQIQIARQLTDRKSKDYNPREAVQWFELAAEGNQPWAMLELAFLYTRGDLGQPDPAQAFKWFERAGSGTPPKHLLGVADTVISLMNGLGTAPDHERALKLARANRDADIVCYLATKGECPAAIVTFDEELALNEQWATKRKDPGAECIMAVRCLNGWGVKADPHQAEKWLQQAVAQGDGTACRILGFLYETMPGPLGVAWADAMVRATQLYRQGAAAGDVEAMCNLAGFYGEGRGGLPVDIAQSQQLYEKALGVDPTCARAANNLGSIFEDRAAAERGRGETLVASADLAKAASLYQRASDLGFDYAECNLGRLQHDGMLGTPDFDKAYDYFSRAAEQGNNNARLALATMLERGEGVAVSMTESAYYLRQAAVEGNKDAMRRLASYYFSGKGGARDYERAMVWLVQLRQAGDRWADTMIADILLRQQRYPEAIKLLESLSRNLMLDVSGFACERLSRCYRDGTGVSRDRRKERKYLDEAFEDGNSDAVLRMANNALAAGKEADALHLFKLSAGEGNAAANYALGQMSYFGQHLPRDGKQALAYFRAAAENYDPDALYFLAAMTAKHVDGAPSLDEAIRMARTAEAVGNPKAPALRDVLEQRRLKELSTSEQTTGPRAL